MKSFNLFTRFFTIVVLLTMGSLALSAFSAKKAYEADPELLAKVEKKFNIQVHRGGFSGIPLPIEARFRTAGNCRGIKKNSYKILRGPSGH